MKNKVEEITVETEKFADITEILTFGDLVAFNCISNSELILVVAKKELDYRDETAHGSFSKTKTKEGQDYSVFRIYDGQVIKVADIDNEPYNIHDVQLLPEDRILLICARCRRRSSSEIEANGRVYSADGLLVDEIVLGDGIQDVKTNDSGEIWTSYFDEGIFGNFGWDDPLGKSGLVKWSEDGKALFEFEPISGLDYICDCYALNLESKNTIWAYYYTDFPLVRIKPGTIEDYWNVQISGSSSFAIYRNFALFSGGYDDKSCFHLVELGKDHKSKLIKNVRLTNINEIEWITSYGDSLFILSKSSIHKLSVHEVN